MSQSVGTACRVRLAMSWSKVIGGLGKKRLSRDSSLLGLEPDGLVRVIVENARIPTFDAQVDE